MRHRAAVRCTALPRLAAKMGLPGAFDRLWQEGLPSPHVHLPGYSDDWSAGTTACAHPRRNHITPSVSATGLYERIRCAGGVRVPSKRCRAERKRHACHSISQTVPPDIQVWFLRKVEVRKDAYERV